MLWRIEMSEASPARREVLLVDDDALVIEGLLKSLRKYRKAWAVEVVNSAAAAIEALERKPRDAIVSDARMPEADGAWLMGEVQRRWPETVRVVLTGEVTAETLRRMSHIAHQLLAKPASAEAVFACVESALKGRDPLDAGLRSTVCAFGPLPSLPSTYLALRELLSRSDASVEEAAGIVEQAPGVAAALLKLVNSAYFGLGRRIATIREAVPLLGLRQLATIVLAAELYPRNPARADRLQRRAARRIELAPVVLGAIGRPEWLQEVVTAVVLCDIGELVAGQREVAMDEVDAAVAAGEEAALAETRVLGIDLPALGAALLSVWGLPSDVVGAVARQRNASADGASMALVVACLVAATNGAGSRGFSPLATAFQLQADRLPVVEPS